MATIAIIKDSLLETVSALEAKNKFGQLLENAQRSPVMVTKNGRDVAVVVSARAYNQRRQHAWQQLQHAMTVAGDYAEKQGLTEEKLEQLLADES